jgi:hypothetical protein
MFAFKPQLDPARRLRLESQFSRFCIDVLHLCQCMQLVPWLSLPHGMSHVHDTAIHNLLLYPRELATQIYRVFSQISPNYTDINCLLFIGGTDIADTSSNFEHHGGQVSTSKSVLQSIIPWMLSFGDGNLNRS